MTTAFKLTPKQGRFIEEYLVDGNATAAAKRAGYSAKSARVVGQETLSNPAVKAALAARQAAEAERLGVTREKVVARLWEAAEQAKRMGDPAGIVKACAELNRLFNFYAHDRPEPHVPVGQTHLEAQMMRMTDAELEAILQNTNAV